jgi:hypothetical protein
MASEFHKKFIEKFTQEEREKTLRELDAISKGYVEIVCQGCNETYLGPEPQTCCSGRDCGCMGMPIEPMVCSTECFDRLMERVRKEPTQEETDSASFKPE